MVETTRDAVFIIRVTGLRNEADYLTVATELVTRIRNFNTQSAVIKLSIEQGRYDRTDQKSEQP